MRSSIIRVAAAAVAATATAVDAAPVHAAVDYLERRSPTDLASMMSFLKTGVKTDADQSEKISLLGGYPTRSAPLDVSSLLGRKNRVNHSKGHAPPSELEDESLMWHDEEYKRWRLKQESQWSYELQELQKKALHHTAVLDEWLPKGCLGIRYPNPGAKLYAQEASKRAEEILRLGMGKEGYKLRRFGSASDSVVLDRSKKNVASLLERGDLLLWMPVRY